MYRAVSEKNSFEEDDAVLWIVRKGWGVIKADPVPALVISNNIHRLAVGEIFLDTIFLFCFVVLCDRSLKRKILLVTIDDERQRRVFALVPLPDGASSVPFVKSL